MTTVSMPATSRPSTTKRAPRSNWFGPSMPFARFGLIVNLALPLGLLAWDGFRHRLGVNAVQYAIHTTGLIAILYLLASLVVTPLRQITRLEWLTQFRRSLGVYAFYYAAAHLSIYFWWDQGHNLKSTAYEITHRYYLTIGFTSLAIMAPLWATSFNAAIRWMGGNKWKWLHRTTYVAAFLAGVHYYLQSKSYKFYPELWFAVFWALMFWRVGAAVVHYVRKPARAAPKAVAASAGGKARNWKGDLKVVGMFKETPAVRTFRLAAPDGKPVPFTFSAGQFLSLKVKVDDKDESRSYTIASPPTRDAYVELTVKREKDGHVSKYLHDMLMTGQSVAVTAPAGRFTFDAKDEDGVLMVAGGVGVTPVMSILRDLTDRCWPGKIDLVFSVKAPDDVIFEKELDLLTARHPNLRVHKTFTQSTPPDWTGPRGRITAELLKQLVPEFVGRPALVCGPDAMAKAVHEELRSAGVAEKRITMESFTSAAAAPPKSAGSGEAAGHADAPSGEAATATFQMSGQTASIAADQTVLEAAEAAGVRIDYQCRSGICGTCRCRLLEGTVHMNVRDALSDADEADGYILACQAYADGDVTIDA